MTARVISTRPRRWPPIRLAGAWGAESPKGSTQRKVAARKVTTRPVASRRQAAETSLAKIDDGCNLKPWN